MSFFITLAFGFGSSLSGEKHMTLQFDQIECSSNSLAVTHFSSLVFNAMKYARLSETSYITFALIIPHHVCLQEPSLSLSLNLSSRLMFIGIKFGYFPNAR